MDLHVLLQVSRSRGVKVADLAADPSHGPRDLMLLLPVGKEEGFGREVLAADVAENCLLPVIVSGADVIFQIGLGHVPT